MKLHLLVNCGLGPILPQFTSTLGKQINFGWSTFLFLFHYIISIIKRLKFHMFLYFHLFQYYSFRNNAIDAVKLNIIQKVDNKNFTLKNLTNLIATQI